MCKGLKSSLLTYSNICKTVNIIYFGQNKAISRHQIIFLMYLSTLDKDSLTPVKMANYGYSYYNSLYYIRTFKSAGHIIKVSRGHYQLTEKGLSLVNTFLDHAGLLPK